MAELETRLTLAEDRIVRHQVLHAETQSNIREISGGVAKLVEAEARRGHYEETFSRIFGTLEKLDQKVQRNLDAQAEKELAAYRGIVWKVLGLAALLGASMIAGRLGSTLIGG